MAIRPELAFGPIAKAIDTIVADADRTEGRLFQARRDEQKQEATESRFRRAGNLRAAMDLLDKKNLDPESRKAIAGSLSTLISDPDAQLIEPEFKPEPPPEQTFAASKDLAPFAGVPEGTPLTAAQMNVAIDNRRAQQTQDRLKEKDKASTKAAETKAQIAAKDKADRKKSQESKDFIGSLNRLQSDLRNNLKKLQKTEDGERFALEGKEDEVAAIELELEDLETIERIEGNLAEPESLEQVKDWLEKGYLSEKRAIDMVEEFDLDATAR